MVSSYLIGDVPHPLLFLGNLARIYTCQISFLGLGFTLKAMDIVCPPGMRKYLLSQRNVVTLHVFSN